MTQIRQQTHKMLVNLICFLLLFTQSTHLIYSSALTLPVFRRHFKHYYFFPLCLPWFHCTNHQNWKYHAVHLTRSSPAPTISSLLHSCLVLVFILVHVHSANAALITYSPILLNRFTNLNLPTKNTHPIYSTNLPTKFIQSIYSPNFFT